MSTDATPPTDSDATCVRCGVDRDPIAEFGSLFTRDGERFVPTQLARGPWDPNAMHGGAPSALMAHVLRAPRSWSGVVHRPIDRRAAAAGAARTDAGRGAHVPPGQERAVGRSRVARRRRRGGAGGCAPAARAARRRGGDGLARSRGPTATGRGRAPAVRVLRPRPHRVLVRQRDPARRRCVRRRRARRPRGSGCGARSSTTNRPTPFERVAAVADFGSGVGNPLTFTTASAINPEVTIHVHRHPEGEWVCLESGGWAETHGVGLADSRLYDERGVLGRALQSLLVTPMSAPRPPDFAR